MIFTKNINTKKPILRFKGFIDEWKEVRLEEIADINPPTKKPDYKFIYLDLASVKKGQIINYKKQQFKIHLNLLKTFYNNKTYYSAKVRPYQQNNLLFREQDGQEYVASTGFIQIRVLNNSLFFIYYFLHTNKINKKVISLCTGTTYPVIRPIDFKNNIKILLPCLNEQNKITTFFSLIDEKINIQLSIFWDDNSEQTNNKEKNNQQEIAKLQQIIKDLKKQKKDNENFKKDINLNIKRMDLSSYGMQ
ncbi:restriction endonuclease subunit S [Candidatus Phytoplasma fraxini]|uniref:Type I restriction modification DNA specificity domain-containing protein n=1 Tax=Ash yellows phytoplasma TaxID=35780 RepID=A0ABZ2U7R6_ASHYP